MLIKTTYAQKTVFTSVTTNVCDLTYFLFYQSFVKEATDNPIFTKEEIETKEVGFVSWAGIAELRHRCTSAGWNHHQRSALKDTDMDKVPGIWDASDPPL